MLYIIYDYILYTVGIGIKRILLNVNFLLLFKCEKKIAKESMGTYKHSDRKVNRL